MHGHKPRFTDAGSVDAWDAWFRWRQEGTLRDVSIEDTWARVTGSLAQAERPGQAPPFVTQLLDALVAWKLLPDPRIVASAGTDHPCWPDDELAAVLNAASFVRNRHGVRASFDHAAFAATAGLAVRMLDNAAQLSPCRTDRAHVRTQVGLVGLADALALLGLAYDSAPARAQAHQIARSLAEGCLQGDLQLARERGARTQPNAVARPTALRTTLAEEGRRTGLRHARLTAITSQHRLAMLANNVADALDPLRHGGTLLGAAHPTQPAPPGLAFMPSRQQERSGTGRAPPAMPVTARAQVLMRGAMQPWIDQPIDYPVTVADSADDSPDPADRLLAQAHGLGPLRLRRVGAERD